MDINGIKNYFNSKKADDKKPEKELQIPQDRTQMDEQQRTMLEKIRGKALAHYKRAFAAGLVRAEEREGEIFEGEP